MSLYKQGLGQPVVTVGASSPDTTLAPTTIALLVGGIGLAYVATRPKRQRQRAAWQSFNRTNPWGA